MERGEDILSMLYSLFRFAVMLFVVSVIAVVADAIVVANVLVGCVLVNVLSSMHWNTLKPWRDFRFWLKETK